MCSVGRLTLLNSIQFWHITVHRCDRQFNNDDCILAHSRRFFGNLTSIIASHPGLVQNIVMTMSVRSSVCLSAQTTRQLHVRTSPNFFCKLSIAVVRSSSNGVAIFLRYVGPISGFVDYVTFFT